MREVTTSGSPAGPAQADPRAASAVDFIRANSANPALRLRDVAAHVGLSACYLDRVLMRDTGAGFCTHLRNARLTHAQRLLLTTHMSVKQIAFAVGYNYANELSRHFRIVHRAKPSSWRRAASMTRA